MITVGILGSIIACLVVREAVLLRRTHRLAREQVRRQFAEAEAAGDPAFEEEYRAQAGQAGQPTPAARVGEPGAPVPGSPEASRANHPAKGPTRQVMDALDVPPSIALSDQRPLVNWADPRVARHVGAALAVAVLILWIA